MIKGLTRAIIMSSWHLLLVGLSGVIGPCPSLSPEYKLNINIGELTHVWSH